MLISPLAVLLLSRMILQERLSNLKYVALSYGVIGGAILLSSTGNRLSVDFNSDFFIGTLLTLASAVSLAVSTIATRKYSKEISSASITFQQFVATKDGLKVFYSLVENMKTDGNDLKNKKPSEV